MSAITVSGKSINHVYAKGETCLMIYPFDNYRMFTLFSDWTSDDKKPLNLSDGQKIFLVFRDKNKEIRIPEYDLTNSSFEVDKVNGQVLFKITKKNAIDILAMNTRTFYITRKFDTSQFNNGLVSFSEDEEVLYSGKFGEKTVDDETDYSTIIKDLNDTIARLKDIIAGLEESNADLIKQNLDYSSQIEKLNLENTALSNKTNELLVTISADKSVDYEGIEYTGQVLSNRVTYIESDVAQDALLKALENLKNDIQS